MFHTLNLIKIDCNLSKIKSYILRIYVDQYMQWAPIDILHQTTNTHFCKYQNLEFLNNYLFQHIVYTFIKY